MIYIVEDDAAIRELEQYALQSSGYEVTSFESSESFWQAMHAAEPELVILDVMLPGEDGFSILKKLRNTPSLRRLPIIMVTAKSSELDTVRGLDCGADDYITKPFGIMEFLSRVRAALRRSAPEEKQNVYAFHEILLDNARHSVTVNGTHIDLTYKEYSLLRLLLENMRGQMPRTCRFVSVITCCFPNGDVLSARGECEGTVAFTPMGEGGFGYDPVFFVPPLKKTFAQLTAEEKNAISHRGKALEAFQVKLREYLEKS